MGSRIFGVEAALQKLVEVHNRDMTNATKAFVMTDGHVFVINHILQDMAKGTVRYSESYQNWLAEHPDVPYPREDVFDLPHYFKLFNDMQERLRQESLKAAQEKTDGKAANEGTGEENQGDQQGGGEGDGNGGDA
jgi:hypothetical protein